MQWQPTSEQFRIAGCRELLSEMRGTYENAGAMVTKDVPPWTMAVGNPAREIKRRGRAE